MLKVLPFQKPPRKGLSKRSALAFFAATDGLEPRWRQVLRRWRRKLRYWPWWRLRRKSVQLLHAAIIAAAFAGFAFLYVLTRDVEEVPAVHFALCERPPHRDCVIDGDTFYLGDQSIRISDIDAPETHPPRCIREANLGTRATARLLRLLNAGGFQLRSDEERDEDIYGRKLRVVVRDGRSLGAILMAEGLARRWTGAREPWCD